MNDELKQVLAELKVMISSGVGHGAGCGCPSCCVDCTTTKQYESSAARFNEAQAFASAESSKSFVQQQSAQFAQLLSMQQEHQKSLSK